MASKLTLINIIQHNEGDSSTRVLSKCHEEMALLRVSFLHVPLIFIYIKKSYQEVKEEHESDNGDCEDFEDGGN